MKLIAHMNETLTRWVSVQLDYTYTYIDGQAPKVLEVDLPVVDQDDFDVLRELYNEHTGVPLQDLGEPALYSEVDNSYSWEVEPEPLTSEQWQELDFFVKSLKQDNKKGIGK